MMTIFSVVLPMFALIGVGFMAARFQGFSSSMGYGLSRYLAYYALPSLLFISMAKAKIPNPIEWGFLASFYIAALTIFALGATWMVMAKRHQDMAGIGLAGSFSNIAQIGLPVIMEVYGPSVAVPVMLLIVFQSPVLFTLATTLAESQRSSSQQTFHAILVAVKATLLSPLVLSVELGFVVNLFGVPVPSMVARGFELLSQTVLPCACFSAGVTLAFNPAAGHIGSAVVMAVFKTVLHPLLTWVLATKVFMLAPEWLAPAVTAAALPIGINAYSFAERYQSGREAVSLSLLISTLMSPLTISAAFALTQS